MFNLSTKENRLKYQEAQIKIETEKGAILETYKGLKIITRHVSGVPRPYFTLLIFRDDAGHPIVNEYHTGEETRLKRIEGLKKSYDLRATRKAEDKAKGKPSSNQAQAAQAIRQELKIKFPNIKFSVTSQGYSMGDNVNVNYQDGPTSDEVEEIINKYQEGHFNGMEDIYEYSNRREDIPQTKYLFVTRSKSEQTLAAIKETALNIWPGNDWKEEQDREREIYKIWKNTSLPAGATVKGFKLQEDHTVILDFEAPNQPTATTEAPNFEPVEVPAGTVQIIDYSEKAIAVIGDTRPIKDKLKSLGGRFNFRLSCGAGWIFPKSKLQEVQKALQPAEPEPTPEPPKDTRRHPEHENWHPLNICDPESSQYAQALKEEAATAYTLKDETGDTVATGTAAEIVDTLNTIYYYDQKDSETEPFTDLETAKEGIKKDGYTMDRNSKTPEEAKERLKDEIKKTVQFFADTDLKVYGYVTEGTKEAAQVQNVTIEAPDPESIAEEPTTEEAEAIEKEIFCNQTPALWNNKAREAAGNLGTLQTGKRPAMQMNLF